MIDEGFFEVSAWQLVDPQLMLAKLKKEATRLKVGLWTIDSGIAPVDLYTYLYARFGAPNGFGMTLKSPTSDNLLHWHWSLQYRDRIIEFMGHTMSAQVAVEGSGEPSEENIQLLILALKADFANCGPAMSAERKRLELWTVFINPYCRLTRVVERFKERLAELDVRNVVLPRTPRSEEEMNSFADRLELGQRVYEEALGICTSLRMLSPVVAESFLNLVIFVLVDPSIREDQRLYDSLFRQEIDVRVRGLHLSCRGFRNSVNVSDNRFKKFQGLMGHRNDFLHGNIVPDKLAYRQMYFDGTIPLPKKYENMAELALVNSLKHVEPEVALADLAVVDGFVSLVLEAIHEKPRALVRAFMATLDPGWREDTKKAGILFPENIVFTVPGPNASTGDEDREQ